MQPRRGVLIPERLPDAQGDGEGSLWRKGLPRAAIRQHKPTCTRFRRFIAEEERPSGTDEIRTGTVILTLDSRQGVRSLLDLPPEPRSRIPRKGDQKVFSLTQGDRQAVIAFVEQTVDGEADSAYSRPCFAASSDEERLCGLGYLELGSEVADGGYDSDGVVPCPHRHPICCYEVPQS